MDPFENNTDSSIAPYEPTYEPDPACTQTQEVPLLANSAPENCVYVAANHSPDFKIPPLSRIAYAVLVVALLVCAFVAAPVPWFLGLAAAGTVVYCLDSSAPSCGAFAVLVVVVIALCVALFQVASLEVVHVEHGGNATNTTSSSWLVFPTIHVA